MRLICGFWHLDGRPAERSRLEQMCHALQAASRPGRVAAWISGPVALATLDFTAGSQHGELVPSVNGDLLAGDFRLTDAADLRPASAESDARLPQDLVAEVLGQDDPLPVRRMSGEFALACWSPRLQRLRILRDAMGVRPLCYHHTPGRHLVFSSLPRGIFASGLLQRQLNQAELGRQILHVYGPGETLFQGVQQVRPGHMVEVFRSDVRELAFWQPEARPTLRLSREAAADALRDLVEDSVGKTVQGGDDVAAHLSGGLDSSALTVLAARQLRSQNRSLRAYSFLGEAWPGIRMDGEEPFVRTVLEQEPDVIWQAVPGSLPDEWLHDQWNPDAPLSLSAGSPENIVCADASAHGVSTVLSGWGGDEGVTFNGRGGLAHAFRTLRWRYLLAELQALRRQRGFPLRNVLIADVLQPQLTRAANERLRRLGRRAALPAVVEPLLLGQDLRQQLTSLPRLVTGPDPLENQLRLMHFGHLSHRTGNFALIGAQYGMAFSFPLLDRPLLDFALAVPRTWHIQNGWKRALFRQAMQGVLPPAIQWRHTKLLSLPGVLHQFASAREQIIDRIQQLARHPLVDHVFDLRAFAELVRALPDTDAVRHPSEHPALAAVPALAHALSYAFFLEQHF